MWKYFSVCCLCCYIALPCMITSELLKPFPLKRHPMTEWWKCWKWIANLSTQWHQGKGREKQSCLIIAQFLIIPGIFGNGGQPFKPYRNHRTKQKLQPSFSVLFLLLCAWGLFLNNWNRNPTFHHKLRAISAPHTNSSINILFLWQDSIVLMFGVLSPFIYSTQQY